MKNLIFFICLIGLSFSSYAQIPIAYDMEYFKFSSSDNGDCPSYKWMCYLQVSLLYEIITPSGPNYWAATDYIDAPYDQFVNIQYSYMGYATVGVKKLRFRTLINGVITPNLSISGDLNSYTLGACNLLPGHLLCCDNGPVFLVRKVGSRSF